MPSGEFVERQQLLAIQVAPRAAPARNCAPGRAAPSGARHRPTHRRSRGPRDRSPGSRRGRPATASSAGARSPARAQPRAKELLQRRHEVPGGQSAQVEQRQHLAHLRGLRYHGARIFGSAVLVFQQAPGHRPPVWSPEDGEQRPMTHLDFQVGDLDSAVAESIAPGATSAATQLHENVRVLSSTGRPPLLPPSGSGVAARVPPGGPHRTRGCAQGPGRRRPRAALSVIADMFTDVPPMWRGIPPAAQEMARCQIGRGRARHG